MRTRFLLIISILICPIIWANMSRPTIPGDYASEPQNDLKNFKVLHEQLTFDLRSLTNSEQINVHAIYSIDNTAEKQTVPLLFLSPGVLKGTVQFNDKEIKAQYLADEETEKIWSHTRKGIADGDFRGVKGILFHITIPPGKHKIEVKYNMQVKVNNRSRVLYKEYIIRYFLFPIKEWGGLDKLTVKVYPPKNWSIDFSANLDFKEDHWQGTFAKIPEDWLHIVTKHPDGIIAPAIYYGGHWLGVVLFIAFYIWFGFKFKTMTPLRCFFLSWFGLLLLVVGTWVGRWIALKSIHLEHLSTSVGYSTAILALILGIIGVAIAIIFSISTTGILVYTRKKND